MAKKQSRGSIIEILSVVGIIATAICLILGKFGVGGTVLNSVGYFCLLVSAVCASWNFIAHSSNTLKVIYYVSVILVLIFAVLMLF